MTSLSLAFVPDRAHFQNMLLNFIDGEFVASQSAKTFQKMNPFSGELLSEVTASDAMDVIKAIQAARRAQSDFAKYTLAQRAELLIKLADALESKAEDYAYREALHQGLPQKFVLEKSLNPAIHAFRVAAELVTQKTQDTSTKTQHRPTGLISIILSWNLSVRILAERVSVAIAAGNICLIKVSEHSPITAQIFGEALEAAGAPKGLVQMIQGSGPEVGALMSAHPSIRAVNFVGKLTTAENLAKGALPQFKKVQIHAGVKNSCCVLFDADFKTLMPKILESFLIGQGQMGWNTSRLFVTEQMQKEFFEELQKFMATQRPATSPKDETLWYPVISSEALATVKAKSDQLKVEGGKIISGGQTTAEKGYFFQPTISLDLSNCSELQQEEMNGPILIVTVVKNQAEMAKWSNTGYYGHSAVIWGSSENGLRLANMLDVGTVSLNEWLPQQMEIGHRQSAYGNLDTHPWGNFYSDVKVLTGFET
ncbi:MAG: aldehyde dehydrogenase family protein [Bdellovibrionaceae bacterium]|nr:aldehyde dehydrogenase family protein [Pseudobdellovibrionaceae bacterium]